MTSNKKGTAFNGWLILDKPLNITSAHAVAKVKRLLRPLKIGHAGTLDPLASGILPLALGEATKTVPYMMDAAKTYAFTVTWGQERATDDAEGEVIAESVSRPTNIQLIETIERFKGVIQQTPPKYSAIKMEGRRAYDMARAGEDVLLKSREVRIDRLECVDFSSEFADFVVDCGKGTYVRSLARDIGRALGCYGYVSSLRRLRVGKFAETHAISLEKLENMVHKGGLGFLQPVESALDDILARDVTPHQATLLKRGMPITISDVELEKCESRLLLARCDGKALAICEWSQGMMKPVRVFNI